MNQHDALRYEIAACPIAGFCSWNWAQDLVARYLAWKVSRKWRRYQRYLAITAIHRWPSTRVD